MCAWMMIKKNTQTVKEREKKYGRDEAVERNVIGEKEVLEERGSGEERVKSKGK